MSRRPKGPYPALPARTDDVLYVWNALALLTLDGTSLAGDCPVTLDVPDPLRWSDWSLMTPGAPGTLCANIWRGV